MSFAQRVTPIAKHLPGFTASASPSETGAAPARSEVRLRVKPTTPELTVEGWVVNLTGSSTLQANTVVVAGTDRHRMGLLVIPPPTPGDIARAVLRSTARPDAVGSVEAILASHGVDTTRSIRLHA